MTGGEGAVVRTILHTGTGLVRRLVDMPSGSRLEGTAGPGGELWFVIAGTGRLEPGRGAGTPVPVRRATGLCWPPGARYRLHAGGPRALRLDCVCLPAGAAAPPAAAGASGRDWAGADPVPQLRELDDCAVQVTGDRRFRVLFGPGQGCEAATQFVGEIPAGRAPEHSHPYDEVVLVLEGEGVLHTGPADRPLAAGGCAHLPPGKPHCLENTGRTMLRVLGVFHPGGSPAAKQPPPPPRARS